LLAYTGRAPVSVGPVDLHVLVDDLAQLIGAALLGRGVLRRIRGGGPATVTADAAQLQQLVMNLIVNAADALGEAGASGAGGGGVTVETGYRDGLVYLRVTDAGCGMDEATRARMFDPYFTTKRFGRGLGLAGVLGIVRAHRGAIDVTSAPGQGTTVEVTLPAGDGAAAGTSASGGASPAAPAGPADAGLRGDGVVVVADDEPAVRAAVSLVLADAGFRVVEAADGVAALAALAAHTAATAIVLDATMPNLGGVEALRRLRAAGNAIPAVLISGYQETAISAELSAAMQPVEFLGKPFEVAELLASLRHALAHAR
jgi:CheY-like chemotaxis protein